MPDPAPTPEPAPAPTPAPAKKWKVGGVKGMPELEIEADDERAAVAAYIKRLRLSRGANPRAKLAD